ncbi:hypothetical protein AB836_00440 [Rickettsiales bacterium (ex Bugula neritina AB1)]|nr:hypothetical protein AB836_00440 [Rickettsiales bacterium (ex Bugula neritina AB1)]
MILLIILHIFLELLPVSSSLLLIFFNINNKYFLHFFSGIFIFIFYFYKYFNDILRINKKLLFVIYKILLTTLPSVLVVFLKLISFKKCFIISIINSILLLLSILLNSEDNTYVIKNLGEFDDIISYKTTLMLAFVNILSHQLQGVSRMGTYLIVLLYYKVSLVNAYIYTLICSVPLLIGAGYMEKNLIITTIREKYFSLIIVNIIIFLLFVKGEKYFYKYLKNILLLSIIGRLIYSIIGIINLYL